MTDEEGYVFLARDLMQGEQALEDTETDLILKHLPFSEAINLLEQGGITDVISIAGLLAVEKMINAQG